MGSYGPSGRALDGLRTALERSVLVTLTLHEIKLGFKNNLQRVWMVMIFFFGFLFILAMRSLESVYAIEIFFGLFGSMVAVVLAANTISGEVGGIADSLLSKAVRRWEYLVSKFLSQIAMGLIVYLVIVGIAVLVLWNFDWFPDRMSYHNLGVIIGMLALVLVFFSSLGVMVSSTASRPVFAFLLSIVVWFVFVVLFLFMQSWDFAYSPAQIITHLDAIQDNQWHINWVRLVAFYLIAPMFFLTVSLGAFYQRDL
jgi:ABC-type transport system involved in multi-copper enzyme maturation permease subunit